MAMHTDVYTTTMRDLDPAEINAISGGAMVRISSLKVAGMNIDTFYDAGTRTVIGVGGTDGEVMALVIRPL